MPTGVYPRKNPRRIEGDRDCYTCSNRFDSVRSQSQPSARFCSRACLVKWLHYYRRKLKCENDEVLRAQLHRLYWDERMTLKTIAEKFGVNHKVVHTTMRIVGVPTRTKGKRPEPIVCEVEGCQEPPKRIWHAKHQVFYGKKCAEHLRQYKNAKSRYMKSSSYPKISEEERCLRKAKETLWQIKKLVRASSHN